MNGTSALVESPCGVVYESLICTSAHSLALFILVVESKHGPCISVHHAGPGKASGTSLRLASSRAHSTHSSILLISPINGDMARTT